MSRRTVGPEPTIRHGRLPRSGALGTIARALGAVVGVVAVSAVALVAVIGVDLNNQIAANSFVLGGSEPGTDANSAQYAGIGSIEGGVNLMVVGSDSRAGDNARFGSEPSALNDVNILVHISENHDNVVVVSFPRDLIVPLPSCPRSDGTYSGTSSATALNNAMYYGGLGTNAGDGMNCVVLTIENLTGLKIPYAAMIDFTGVIRMSDAVGGVDVCISGGDLYDPDSKVYPGGAPLSLTEGEHTIQGGEALAYLRSRHGVGDGSDLGRISSQQAYLSSLIRKVKDPAENILGNPARLYALGTAAVQNMNLSTSLTGLDTLVALAGILSEVDLDKIAFVQYPGSTGSSQFPGKVMPDYTVAATLFDALKADQAIAPGSAGVGADHTDTVKDQKGGGGGKKNRSETITGLTGQLATDVSCSVANN